MVKKKTKSFSMSFEKINSEELMEKISNKIKSRILEKAIEIMNKDILEGIHINTKFKFDVGDLLIHIKKTVKGSSDIIQTKTNFTYVTGSELQEIISNFIKEKSIDSYYNQAIDTILEKI